MHDNQRMSTVARKGTGSPTDSTPYQYSIYTHMFLNDERFPALVVNDSLPIYSVNFQHFQQRGTNMILIDGLISGDYELTIDAGTLFHDNSNNATITPEIRRGVIRFLQEFPAIFNE